MLLSCSSFCTISGTGGTGFLAISFFSHISWHFLSLAHLSVSVDRLAGIVRIIVKFCDCESGRPVARGTPLLPVDVVIIAEPEFHWVVSLDSVALPTDRRRTASQKGCGSALSDPKQESAHLQVRVPQLITETLIHVATLVWCGFRERGWTRRVYEPRDNSCRVGCCAKGETHFRGSQKGVGECVQVLRLVVITLPVLFCKTQRPQPHW